MKHAIPSMTTLVLLAALVSPLAAQPPGAFPDISGPGVSEHAVERIYELLDGGS